MIRKQAPSSPPLGNGLTLQEALSEIFDPAARARLDEIAERLAVLQEPRARDPWYCAWDEDSDDFRNEERRNEIARLESEEQQIWNAQASGLVQGFAEGKWTVSGRVGDNLERTELPANLWSDLRLNWPRSSGSLGELDIHQVRVHFSAIPVPDGSGPRLTRTDKAIQEAVQALWEGTIPPNLRAKKRDDMIRNAIRQAGGHPPAERTIRESLSRLGKVALSGTG